MLLYYSLYIYSVGNLRKEYKYEKNNCIHDNYHELIRINNSIQSLLV